MQKFQRRIFENFKDFFSFLLPLLYGMIIADTPIFKSAESVCYQRLTFEKKGLDVGETAYFAIESFACLQVFFGRGVSW